MTSSAGPAELARMHSYSHVRSVEPVCTLTALEGLLPGNLAATLVP